VKISLASFTFGDYIRSGLRAPSEWTLLIIADSIDALAAAVGEQWPTLQKARSAARLTRGRLAAATLPLVPAEDASLVVFGSLARDEATTGSDVDWTLLIDGQASSTHLGTQREIEHAVLGVTQREPGPEGIFGGLTFSHELLHRIGGGEDTNRNLTQRILLLLESAAVGPDDAHGRVVKGVLTRYVTEDPRWNDKAIAVPRFLLNDFARYWRTVAVDFAFKRRERAAKGWALRVLKLRMSRKLTFASGLLACFTCELTPSVASAPERPQAIVEHLLGQASHTPLERLAQVCLDHGLHDAARVLFSAYDSFLRLLDDESKRDRLKNLSPDDAGNDGLHLEAQGIGNEFQKGLDMIFFGPNGSRIPDLTRTYGVF
jgi:hypothetical protein